MSKSIKDFPKDVQDAVHELLAKAAQRKAKAKAAMEDKTTKRRP